MLLLCYVKTYYGLDKSNLNSPPSVEITDVVKTVPRNYPVWRIVKASLMLKDLLAVPGHVYGPCLKTPGTLGWVGA